MKQKLINCAYKDIIIFNEKKYVFPYNFTRKNPYTTKEDFKTKFLRVYPLEEYLADKETASHGWLHPDTEVEVVENLTGKNEKGN